MRCTLYCYSCSPSKYLTLLTWFLCTTSRWKAIVLVKTKGESAIASSSLVSVRKRRMRSTPEPGYRILSVTSLPPGPPPSKVFALLYQDSLLTSYRSPSTTKCCGNPDNIIDQVHVNCGMYLETGTTTYETRHIHEGCHQYAAAARLR